MLRFTHAPIHVTCMYTRICVVSNPLWVFTSLGFVDALTFSCLQRSKQRLFKYRVICPWSQGDETAIYIYLTSWPGSLCYMLITESYCPLLEYLEHLPTKKQSSLSAAERLQNSRWVPFQYVVSKVKRNNHTRHGLFSFHVESGGRLDNGKILFALLKGDELED